MNDRQNQLRLDLLVNRYLDAVETGDLETVSRLWAESENDTELQDALHAINEALAAETSDEAAGAAAVTSAVERHMPSAAIIQPASGPITVGDVAEYLVRTPRFGLTGEDLRLNDKLRLLRDPLPDDLGLGDVLAWGAKFGDAPETFWKAFRQAALKLRMQRASEDTFQMAARPAPKPQEGQS
jgi:hypothetical protein